MYTKFFACISLLVIHLHAVSIDVEKSTSILKSKSCVKFSWTVVKQVNLKYYVITTTDRSEVISVIPTTENSMLPITHVQTVCDSKSMNKSDYRIFEVNMSEERVELFDFTVAAE